MTTAATIEPGSEREPFTITTATVVLPTTAEHSRWIAERANGIGGSEIAAAVGIDKYDSPYSLWLLKTGRRVEHFSAEQEERMYTGQLLEPTLRDEFARRHPEYIVTLGAGTYAVPGAEWRRCNVDGLVWTHDGVLAGVLECKTGNHRQLPAWQGDEIPLSYTVQGQWCASIVDAPNIFYIALIDTNTWIEKTVERDDELVADLIDMAADFWRHVTDDTEPPIDGHTATTDALTAQAADPDKEAALADEWEIDFANRDKITAQIKTLEAKKREIDNRIRHALGDAEIGYLNGRKAVTCKAPAAPTRRMKWAEFRKNHPRLYRRYVTETPAARRLNITYTPDQEHTES